MGRIDQLSRSGPVGQSGAEPSVRLIGRGRIQGREVAPGDANALSRPRSTRVATSSTPVLSRTSSAADVGGPSGAPGRSAADPDAAIKAEVAAASRKFDALQASIGALAKEHPFRQGMEGTMDALSDVADLMSQAPAGDADVAAHRSELSEAVSKLGARIAQAKANAPRSLDCDVAAGLDALDIDLEQASAEQGGALDGSPAMSVTSERAIHQVRAVTVQGAMSALEYQIDRHKGTPAAAVLTRALDAVKQHHDALQTHLDEASLSKDEMKAFIGRKEKDGAKAMLAGTDFASDAPGAGDVGWNDGVEEMTAMTALLKTAFAQAGLDGLDAKAELNTHRRDVLNNRDWPAMAFDVPVEGGVLRSVMTPQSKVHAAFADMKGGGVNCHMAQAYKHCPNVVVTEAKVGDSVLFKGIRHGVMSAYDITPEAMRAMPAAERRTMVADLLFRKPDGTAKDCPIGTSAKDVADRMSASKGFNATATKLLREAAADCRAYDILKTALTSDGGKMTRALDASLPAADRKVSVTLSSLSLLTPARLNNFKDQERRMRTDQEQALRRLARSEQPVTVRIDDGQGGYNEIKVDVKTRSFNFGVNAFSSGGFSFNNPIAGLFNGWSNSRAQNATAMRGLIGAPADRKAAPGGDVGEWLRGNPTHPDRGTVEILAKQVGDIYDSGAYRSAGNRSARNPYELTSRLALLTHLMGEDTCFNCKSGKDRTGFLDSQVKDLAMRIRVTGRVPEPGVPRDAGETADFNAIATRGGNFEIQALNTGAPGYKMDLKRLSDQVGGKQEFHELVGVSRMVGS